MWAEFIKSITLLFGEDPQLRQIIFLTFRMSIFSTMISTLVGIIIALKLAYYPAGIIRKQICRIINTLMGMPPVVVGVIVFLFLSRSGPLGKYGLLYTIQAMVIAQVTLITPIVAGLAFPVLDRKQNEVNETLIGLNISKPYQKYLVLYESRKQLLAVMLSAFGRSIAEVGAVQLVGGNVQYKTRVMTTAIMLETNRGNFRFAVSLGIVLLLGSFIINYIVSMISD